MRAPGAHRVACESHVSRKTVCTSRPWQHVQAGRGCAPGARDRGRTSCSRCVVRGGSCPILSAPRTCSKGVCADTAPAALCNVGVRVGLTASAEAEGVRGPARGRGRSGVPLPQCTKASSSTGHRAIFLARPVQHLHQPPNTMLPAQCTPPPSYHDRGHRVFSGERPRVGVCCGCAGVMVVE